MLVNYVKEFEMLSENDILSFEKLHVLIDKIYINVTNAIWVSISEKVDVKKYFTNLQLFYFMGNDEFFNICLCHIYDHAYSDIFIVENITSVISKIISHAWRQLNEHEDPEEMFLLKFFMDEENDFKLIDLPKYLKINHNIPLQMEILLTADLIN
ncbi:hypothetical protein MXB_4851, partial [Myxobolus squamalis]